MSEPTMKKPHRADGDRLISRALEVLYAELKPQHDALLDAVFGTHDPEELLANMPPVPADDGWVS